jgi:hypothetical protein
VRLRSEQPRPVVELGPRVGTGVTALQVAQQRDLRAVMEVLGDDRPHELPRRKQSVPLRRAVDVEARVLRGGGRGDETVLCAVQPVDHRGGTRRDLDVLTAHRGFLEDPIVVRDRPHPEVPESPFDRSDRRTALAVDEFERAPTRSVDLDGPASRRWLPAQLLVSDPVDGEARRRNRVLELTRQEMSGDTHNASFPSARS